MINSRGDCKFLFVWERLKISSVGCLCLKLKTGLMDDFWMIWKIFWLFQDFQVHHTDIKIVTPPIAIIYLVRYNYKDRNTIICN